MKNFKDKKTDLSNQDILLLNTKNGYLNLLRPNVPDLRKAILFTKYENKLNDLQIELLSMQKWIVKNEKRVIVITEGRDLAGKGGAIRRMSEHLNPRQYRIVALPKPTDTEKKQWYFERYVSNIPEPGKIVFYNRSWYNRAVLEPVNGFCTKEEYERFMKEVIQFEKMLSDDGIIIIKLYFSITKEEQANRLRKTKKNPLKKWKLSPLDESAQRLWDEYTVYKEKMFTHTNTDNCPWTIIHANKKTDARIEAIEHVLNVIPYST